MKRILIVIVIAVSIILTVCAVHSEDKDKDDYLRIHIRANSNTDIDQDVKYTIKGEVVRVLSPLLEGVKSSDEAKSIVINNRQNIENVCNEVLSKQGFDYVAKCSVRREKFPPRCYGNLTLDEGVYDAVIIELGKAKGDNWWCVVFPPLCFVETEMEGSDEIRYVSKIGELIANIGK